MKILFVCSGNTCRSCLAEALFNKYCDIEGITSESAGVAAIHDSKSTHNAVAVLKEFLDIDISQRKAVQLTEDIISHADLVLTMTNYIKDVVVHKFPHSKSLVYNLNEFVGVNGDVVDPFGGDMFVYRKTLKQLNNGILLLIEKLKGDRGVE
jgi:protein-tyrosine phosphatase